MYPTAQLAAPTLAAPLLEQPRCSERRWQTQVLDACSPRSQQGWSNRGLCIVFQCHGPIIRLRRTSRRGCSKGSVSRCARLRCRTTGGADGDIPDNGGYSFVGRAAPLVVLERPPTHDQQPTGRRCSPLAPAVRRRPRGVRRGQRDRRRSRSSRTAARARRAESVAAARRPRLAISRFTASKAVGSSARLRRPMMVPLVTVVLVIPRSDPSLAAPRPRGDRRQAGVAVARVTPPPLLRVAARQVPPRGTTLSADRIASAVSWARRLIVDPSQLANSLPPSRSC